MARSNIGVIATTVTAKTAPFSRGMKRAKGEAKQFGHTAKTNIAGTLKKSVQPAFTKLTKMFSSPMGIIASIGTAVMSLKRFGNMMGQTASKLDEIGKTSSRLEIATEELSALEFAGQQTGVEMNDLTKGLERFNKRVGLAAHGTGEAASMMDRLGIDAKTFVQLPISERLGIIADKIKNAGNAAQRAAIADKFFGRAGASSLMNLLQEGSSGIEKLTGTAKDLGIAMESHVVASIEQANDTMNRFSNRADGLWRQITGDLWPALGILLEDMEKFETKSKRAADRSTGQKLVDWATKFTGIGGMLGGQYVSRARSRQEQMKAAEPLSSGERFRKSRTERQERFQRKQLEVQQAMLKEQQRLRQQQEQQRRQDAPTISRF